MKRVLMINNILILCIGNICRSPIAEALFADRFKQASLDTVTSSAGLAALVAKPADTVGQALMLERGFDISNHRARQISPEILFGSDLILTMTTDQQKQVELKYPSTCGRVHRLGKWGCYDVPDPFQRPKLVFEQALALIEQGVDEWYRTLWA
jgi:protein-tyrosine phosphatase